MTPAPRHSRAGLQDEAKMRILITLGALRDGMSPEAVKAFQDIAKLENRDAQG